MLITLVPTLFLYYEWAKYFNKHALSYEFISNALNSGIRLNNILKLVSEFSLKQLHFFIFKHSKFQSLRNTWLFKYLKKISLKVKCICEIVEMLLQFSNRLLNKLICAFSLHETKTRTNAFQNFFFHPTIKD